MPGGFSAGYSAGYGNVGTGLVNLLVDVADTIENAVVVEKVAVTPGEPAASDKCSAVYVWGSQVFDADVSTQARGDIAGCSYIRAYVINYRIDVCMDLTEDGSELTTAEYLEKSTEYYDLIDTIFCELVYRASDGTLFDGLTCQAINLQPIVIGGPIGDRISATGTIRVTDPCPPE